MWKEDYFMRKDLKVKSEKKIFVRGRKQQTNFLETMWKENYISRRIWKKDDFSKMNVKRFFEVGYKMETIFRGRMWKED